MNNTSTNVLPQSAKFAVGMALGPKGYRVVQTINQWLTTNGKEWTVTRLKALRVAALQLRAGNPDLVRKIYQSNSIAYYHGSLIPRGVYRSVFTLFLQAQKPSVIRRLEVVLRVYTSLRLKDLSEKQFLKAKKAINTPYQGTDDALHLVNGVIQEGLESIKTGSCKSTLGRLYQADGSPKIGKPSLRKLRMFTSTHKGDVSSSVLGDVPYGKACLSIATCTCWPEAFKDLYPLDVFDFIRSRVWSDGTDNDFCGHIGFIQEPGAKARVVAVPSALLQWGFEPLHSWLDAFLRRIPTSDVHDQNQGAFFIESRMNEGKTLFSFDLSSATDRFPREVQTNLLEHLGLSEYAKALNEICTEPFKVSTRFGEEEWMYKCGQPMGLYGSFPLFSLAHVLLLEGLCAIEGVPSANTFRLIGDDVIIANPAIAAGYRYVMGALGVDISEEKTMQSSLVAEFAGFVGYRTNRKTALFRPYKHRDCKEIHNPVGLLFALGKALRRTSSSYWSSMVTLFQRSRRWRNPDLSPIIPVTDGAEGVNPSVIDTSRLENLLATACAAAGSTRNSWTGDEYDLFDLSKLACILLDKQYGEVQTPHRIPMDLLATPEVDTDRNVSHSVELTIKTDPLMSDQTLEWLGGSNERFEDPEPAKVLETDNPLLRAALAADTSIEIKKSNGVLKDMGLFG